ncbi:MAG: phage major capsid protein [Rhizobiaceae bacterium]|nr:phage major capsid protein [Rhizobiaceae bacterium]MDF2374074.1 phage major capsid protein [Rhizobiaceae bacterium]|tara:strand:- start:124098 stop:125105 length:1008 start_codon:yes stop_codon:yes gene_type:complete
MALNSNERLQEAFSLALEDRSKGYQDLVSNSNAILYLMKQKNGFKAFSGPTIRERLLYNESGTYTRYSGYQYLNPSPAELFNDAEFTPKLAAVSVTLSGEDILKNSGASQLKDIMEEHISAAEQELVDRFVEDLHADGTAANQIGGLQLAIPTTAGSGTYGGISRADNAIWRTSSYDAHSAFSGITQVTSSTIKTIFDNVMIERSRGTKGPDCITCSQEHYIAYTGAMTAIQRIQDENELGKLGFTNLKYYGAGKSVDVVLEGGIGSAMPANTSYFLDSSALRFRYHPDRNFVKFGGKQAPVNQDAIVQHIGFYGNLTLNNPLHVAKLHDSNVAA